MVGIITKTLDKIASLANNIQKLAFLLKGLYSQGKRGKAEQQKIPQDQLKMWLSNTDTKSTFIAGKLRHFFKEHGIESQMIEVIKNSLKLDFQEETNKNEKCS